jgi:hypothetical protein
MGTETEALENLEELCRGVSPFEVTMGDVESFAPRTPTVFVRVAHAAYRMRELHDRLNTGVLEYEEPWPYMPHMTVAKMLDFPSAARALEIAQECWARYTGPRRGRFGARETGPKSFAGGCSLIAPLSWIAAPFHTAPFCSLAQAAATRR